MKFVTQRVKFNCGWITLVFPFTKQELINSKVSKFTQSQISFQSLERVLTLNGGYVKELF